MNIEKEIDYWGKSHLKLQKQVMKIQVQLTELIKFIDNLNLKTKGK